MGKLQRFYDVSNERMFDDVLGLARDGKVETINRNDGLGYVPGTIWQRIEQGDNRPWAGREVRNRNSVFVLDLAPGVSEYFIRIHTTSSSAARLTLWQPAAFASYSALDMVLVSGFAMAIVVIILINLLMAAYLRERLNLLSNALKYSPAESLVSVDFLMENRELRVIVSDMGGGIPGAELPQIHARQQFVSQYRPGPWTAAGQPYR